MTTRGAKAAFKEVERMLCFTDMPCGAVEMEKRPAAFDATSRGEELSTALSVELSVLSKEVESVIKEMDRTLFFSDVPTGVLKNTREDATNLKDVPLLERIRRSLCFSDLKDIDESRKLCMEDLQRIRWMKSMEDSGRHPLPGKNRPPPGGDAATDSSSSDDRKIDHDDDGHHHHPPKRVISPAMARLAEIATAVMNGTSSMGNLTREVVIGPTSPPPTSASTLSRPQPLPPNKIYLDPMHDASSLDGSILTLPSLLQEQYAVNRLLQHSPRSRRKKKGWRRWSARNRENYDF